MNNSVNQHEPDPDFMRAVSEMSEFGFKFASSNPNGVNVGDAFDPETPSVVMVSDPSVMKTVLPNAIACMYEDAPSASYLFFAIDQTSVSEADINELGNLGGYVFEMPSGVNHCVAISMKDSDGPGEGRWQDLGLLMSKLSEMKLPTVPYPCTGLSLSVLPMFAKFAFEKLKAPQAVPILSKYFGNSLNVLKMDDNLSALVVQHNLASRKFDHQMNPQRAMRA